MKAHTRKEKELPEKLTAQDFVNVQSIEGRLLKTRDKMLFTYALIKSNDFSLMTEKEKSIFIENVCRILAVERKPFKLIIMPRSIDISGMLGMLLHLKSSTNDPIRLELIRKEMDFISSFTEGQDIKESVCYLVMWDNQAKNMEHELLRRMDVLMMELQKYNIVAQPLDQAGIAFMCNLFAYPQYAHGFDVEDLEFSIPRLKEEPDEAVS